MPKQKCFYATFGLAHPLRDRVQRILVPGDNPSEALAREAMNSFYGSKWAFIYGPHEVREDDTVVLGGDIYRLIDYDISAGEVYQ